MQALEIMSQPPDERYPNNPWPQWPIIFRTDYGHEERKEITGDDPRLFGLSTKVSLFYILYHLKLLNKNIFYKNVFFFLNIDL